MHAAPFGGCLLGVRFWVVFRGCVLGVRFRGEERSWIWSALVLEMVVPSVLSLSVLSVWA